MALIDDLPAAIVEVLKKLVDRRVAVIEIVNNTDQVIRRGVPTFESGGFEVLPPDNIEAGQKGHAVAANRTNSPRGSVGELPYFLTGDTTWFMNWSNPRAGETDSDTRIDGASASRFSADHFAGIGDTAQFRFSIVGSLSPRPQPRPSGGDADSSCIITVTNNTQSVLTLGDQGHERGDFMTFPNAQLQPGAASQFASVETPGAQAQGSKGFLVYEVGAPGTCSWRVEWDNPENAQNTTASTLTGPQAAGFRALDQIGQGEENVPVAFTISGSGQPAVPPEPEPEFAPPVEQRQPTLRRGDESDDGWVDYLQQLLNHQLGAMVLSVDGDFGAATLAAVLRFQSRERLLEDGVVGNQTWAALREATPEPPSTDGLVPHTHVERGPEARWATESNDFVAHNEDRDELLMMVISVGDQAAIDDFKATTRVTPASGVADVDEITIGPAFQASDAGAIHFVRIPRFRERFGVGTHTIEAYLPQELGGDLHTGLFTL